MQKANLQSLCVKSRDFWGLNHIVLDLLEVARCPMLKRLEIDGHDDTIRLAPNLTEPVRFVCDNPAIRLHLAKKGFSALEKQCLKSSGFKVTKGLTRFLPNDSDRRDVLATLNAFQDGKTGPCQTLCAPFSFLMGQKSKADIRSGHNRYLQHTWQHGRLYYGDSRSGMLSQKSGADIM